MKEIERESRKLESESSVTAIEGEQPISKPPQETKELIFGKLPFELSCNFRRVCKEWNSILSSQKFLASLPTQNPWLVMYDVGKNGNCNCVAYCFLAQKWRELSLSLFFQILQNLLTFTAMNMRTTLSLRFLPDICQAHVRDYSPLVMPSLKNWRKQRALFGCLLQH